MCHLFTFMTNAWLTLTDFYIYLMYLTAKYLCRTFLKLEKGGVLNVAPKKKLCAGQTFLFEEKFFFCLFEENAWCNFSRTNRSHDLRSKQMFEADIALTDMPRA